MVAGSLKKPWGTTGTSLRFGEDLWASGDPAAEWTEHELVPGDYPVFHRRFAGKDRADTPDLEEGEYLCVEELCPDNACMPPGPEQRMAAILPDFTEVRLRTSRPANVPGLGFYQ